jgi:hypothetical protein
MTETDPHDATGIWGLPDRVPHRVREAGFVLLLGAYVSVIILKAVDYSQQARRFPLVIGVPLLGLILLKTVLLVGGGRLSLPATGLVSDMVDLDTGGDDHAGALIQRQREFEVIVWIGLLVGMVWGLGFQVGGVLFVAGFVFRYQRDPKRALLVAAITYAIIYLLFIRLLNRRLVEPALLPDVIVQLLP